MLYTGGVKSWSIVSALQDLKMVVVATGTTKSTEEDKKRIRELMGSTIESPVWEAVTRPTPWEPAGTATISRSQLLRA